MYNTEKIKKDNIKNIKLKLFNFQKNSVNKMINIEKNNWISMKYTLGLDFLNNPDIKYNPILDKYSYIDQTIKIKTNGGILNDDMGLGKSVTALSLIANNKLREIKDYITVDKYEKKMSYATLIICPLHLIKQWQQEIKKTMIDAKVIVILTRADFNKLTYNKFIHSDIILTTYQFIGSMYYLSLNYPLYNKYSFDNNERIKHLEKIMIGSDFKENKTIPMFEYFYFHRIILDDIHKLYEFSQHSITKDTINNFSAKNVWLLSGLSYNNDDDLYYCFKIIQLKIKYEDMIYTFGKSDNLTTKNYLMSSYMNKHHMWNSVLELFCIKHYKEDVNSEINIPTYIDDVMFIELTPLERNIYENKKNSYSRLQLQLLCSHLLVLETNTKKRHLNENHITKNREKLLKMHNDIICKYTEELSLLNSNQSDYTTLRNKYNSNIAESRYIINTINKFTDSYDENDNYDDNPFYNDNQCPVCLCDINNPVMTECGHVFCQHCLDSSYTIKNTCPVCKRSINSKNFINMVPLNKINIFDNCGSKVGNLIVILKSLLDIKENNIVIFSQWDIMLEIVSTELTNYEIQNNYIKGNNSKQYKSYKQNNSIRVSLMDPKKYYTINNALAITHIILLDAICDEYGNSSEIEKIAINKTQCIGQDKVVNVMRLITKDTIEEDIYKRL